MKMKKMKLFSHGCNKKIFKQLKFKKKFKLKQAFYAYRLLRFFFKFYFRAHIFNLLDTFLNAERSCLTYMQIFLVYFNVYKSSPFFILVDS